MTTEQTAEMNRLAKENDCFTLESQRGFYVGFQAAATIAEKEERTPEHHVEALRTVIEAQKHLRELAEAKLADALAEIERLKSERTI